MDMRPLCCGWSVSQVSFQGSKVNPFSLAYLPQCYRTGKCRPPASREGRVETYKATSSPGLYTSGFTFPPETPALTLLKSLICEDSC